MLQTHVMKKMHDRGTKINRRELERERKMQMVKNKSLLRKARKGES